MRDVYADIRNERDRQKQLWGGHHRWGKGDCASPDVALMTKIAVLTEEVGECARAALDDDTANMYTELVQVAAVAVAITEST